MCGKNGSTTPNNMLINGTSVGSVNGGLGGYTLTINAGSPYNEAGNFQFSHVIIWDQVLTDAEMKTVSDRLIRQLSGESLLTLYSSIYTQHSYLLQIAGQSAVVAVNAINTYDATLTNSGESGSVSSAGLVLYYRFNSTDTNGVYIANYASGAPVYDASMSVSGLISNTSYAVGDAALNLNGTNPYKFVTYPTISLTASTGYSFAFWMRSNNSNTYARVVDFSAYGPATGNLADYSSCFILSFYYISFFYFIIMGFWGFGEIGRASCRERVFSRV
jgi:hypothetical protein